MPDSRRPLSARPRAAPPALSSRFAQNPLGRYRDAIFFASGFAGLIYESIWTHYLKLFLGHAAYAQTLVLAIFMGGMAIGAALTARYTARFALPLRIYALVEATIGVLALAFHPIFVAATAGFYDVTFGWQWDSIAFSAAKWGLATILILPQSILLGATFPLFASAATRGAPAREGRPIATLYFANSIGGAVGVLVSGFVLVPSLGLFGTIATAGALNLAIAMLVIVLSNAAARGTPARDDVAPAAAKPKPKRAKPLARSSPAVPPSAPARAVPARLLLAVSFLTGGSSFIYEIGWIRMLSLVLGSATHSFELMLSSFVLGLALGGLWIRKRIDSAKNPAVFLGYIQIAMGCAALATVPLHNVSFNIVGWTLHVLPRTDDGYVLFNVMRYGVASLIMFPAAFCAGMTLPLLTRLLYSNAGQGERSIGLIYSTNTVGAIVGLAFAVHIGMPVFGLEYLVATGAMIDVLLGAALFILFGSRSNRRFAFAAVLLGVAATFVVAQTFDPQKLASSVFRSGEVSTRGTIVEVAHGKTATISVETEHGILAIKTNGKTDASANMKPGGHYTPDELTMAMIGVVTLMLHDAPHQVANIGFGSGLTGELILADPRVLHLDTIEIEPKMVDLARHFDPLNRSVYTDPRSAVRIEDAKSFFAANGKTYDVILSEPSNPWVSGVSGLFSVEFYRHVSRYLNQGGLFAQWLHTYEANPDRIVSVLKAMDQAFDDYLVIAIDEADVVFVGRPHGKVAMPPNAYAGLAPQMKAKMRNIDIANQADVAFRIVGNKALFRPWLDANPVAANSDFMPYLDSNADRDRFFDQDWTEFINVALSAVPIAEILGGRPPLPTPSALSITRQFGAEPLWLGARLVWETLFGPAQGPDAFPVPNHLPPNLAKRGADILAACRSPALGAGALGAARLATRVLPYLSPAEGRAVLAALHGAACLDPTIEEQAQWANLLHYLADRDADGFGSVADQMLMSGQGTNAVLTRYLLALAMLGRIHAGKHDRAAALWTQFSRKALDNHPPGLVLELLHAHAVVSGP